jgi:glutathione S-transferase
MAITFYYGAGSPFAWRVWLALEHKGVDYRMKVLSFSEGDLKKTAFAALNPRKQVPVLVDAGADTSGEFVLYESAAILEYLQDAYPNAGAPLFPADTRARALVRRRVCEADNYVAPAVNRLVARVLFTPEAKWNADKIGAARDACLQELSLWTQPSDGDYLAGKLSAADFTLYPMIALALRCESKRPDLSLRTALPQRIGDWMQRIEQLAYFSKTRPAHWQ